jgi:hypothetical protein
MKTSDIAKALGVHVNTVRLYEEAGFLPAIPRGKIAIASTVTYISNMPNSCA